ncbi:MAG: sporulation protein Cse60 [Muribaculaceae bacterium]|nr:sporulation protein Cse60 [Muribaculaceae bacterium]
MKVKTFSSNLTNKLDMSINNFISNHDIEVIDIKFSTAARQDNYGSLLFSAMVIYKDKE